MDTGGLRVTVLRNLCAALRAWTPACQSVFPPRLTPCGARNFDGCPNTRSHFESMRSSSLLMAACALAASYIPAQVLEADGSSQAWQKFLQSQEGHWTAEWSPATGTPAAIYGEGIRLQEGPIATEAGARRHSEATLRRYADLIGQGGSNFAESIAGKMNQTWVFVYDQKFQGLEVLGGRADVRINDIGVLALFGAEAFQIPAGFSTKPTVDPTIARLTAYAAAEVNPPAELRQQSRERLVIWADHDRTTRSPVILAWEVRISGEDKFGRGYVNARTGQFIEYRNDRHECGFPGCSYHDGDEHRHVAEVIEAEEAAPEVNGPFVNVVGKVQAWLNPSIQPNAALQNVPIRGVRVQVVGGNFGLTDVNGNFSIAHSGSAPVQVRVTFDNGRRVGSMTVLQGTEMSTTATLTPGTASTIQIFTQNAAQFDRSQSTSFYFTDKINEWVRLPHIMNNHSTINGADSCRINVNLTRTCNAHYTGNSINFYMAGGACPNTSYSTVVEHEWGHLIDDRFGGISQTDGLSEGWGDILAIYSTGQPIVGPNFSGNRPVRDARNTLTYPAGGGVHQQGQTWMGGAWDVRANLITSLGATVGARRAETIVVGSLIANARNQPNALREVFIADDDDGNINNGTPNCNDIVAAYVTKRRLPSPIRSCSANPGTYTSYGTGCKGTGRLPSSCYTINGNGGTLAANLSRTNEYAYPVQFTTAQSVTGFQMFTRAFSGTASAQIRAYRGTASGPTGSPVSTGTMNAGSSAQFQSATLGTPVAVAANEVIWITQANSNAVSVPQLTAGSASPTLIRWRRAGTTGAWSTTGLVTRPSYKVLCAGGGQGGAIPALSAMGLPEIGRSFSVDLVGAAPSASAVLFLGASRTTWAGTTLPLNLAPLGAPGCMLLASGEASLSVQVGSNGRGSITIPVPNNPSLVNAKVYNQYIVLDAQANNLGLAFSNGGEAKIGKP